MSQRLDYVQQSPELFKKFVDFSLAVEHGIEPTNGWNRVNVAFRTVPGSSDKAFGLTKANLN